MNPGQNPMVYTLEEGFLPEDRSWIDHVRIERMSRKASVLYRPEIVNDLVQRIDELLQARPPSGLMVRGPQGVGKSHSLINLTRYLLASGKYWVTIIPDCAVWRDKVDFFKFLLQSVGVDTALVRLNNYVPSSRDFTSIMADVDQILSKHGMKWVFVFDQINRIFDRMNSERADDIRAPSFPFNMIRRVVERNRIISIISASANNDVWYKDNHNGFDVFDHPTQLDHDEIKILYPASEIAKWDWEEVEYMTGRVPWYLGRWTKDPKHFSADIRNEIQCSLNKLRIEQPDF